MSPTRSECLNSLTAGSPSSLQQHSLISARSGVECRSQNSSRGWTNAYMMALQPKPPPASPKTGGLPTWPLHKKGRSCWREAWTQRTAHLQGWAVRHPIFLISCEQSKRHLVAGPLLNSPMRHIRGKTMDMRFGWGESILLEAKISFLLGL